MSDSFLVVPEELTSHSGSVDKTAGTVSTAAGAAQQVVLNTGSFGVMFAQLGVALNGLGLLGELVAAHTAGELRDLANNLRGAADDYRNVDAEHSRVFDAIASGLNH